MAYQLRAVLGVPAQVRALAAELAAPPRSPGGAPQLAVVAPLAFDAPLAVVDLQQGLGMLALGDGLWTGLRGGAPGFDGVVEGLGRRLRASRAPGPFALVDVEVFAGEGSQSSVVWEGGVVVLGPVHTDLRDVTQDRLMWAVNLALRELGVQAEAGSDEFDTVGLARHRHTDDWPT